MTSFDLLDVIGEIDDKFVLGAHRRKKRNLSKRSMILIAIAAAVLALGGCALMIMKLEEMKLGRVTCTIPVSEYSTEYKVESGDIISLQGIMGSKGYQAASEWQSFMEQYDTDGKMLQEADDSNYFPPMEYMAYNCYTQEMIDKADEICEKYQLKLQGPASFCDSAVQIWEAVGIETIRKILTPTEFELYGGYYYWNGSFSMSGSVRFLSKEEMPQYLDLEPKDYIWNSTVDFQYYCSMKNVFDVTYVNVGDIEEFDQWNYRLEDGTDMLLALSADKALMIVDKEEYFVTINILNPRIGDIVEGEKMMDREALEAVAEVFTFDYVPQPVKPEDRIEPEWFF